MCLLAGEPGMTEDTAEHIADFYTKDRRGKPRTFDLDHVVNFQPRVAVEMIDEVLALREAVAEMAEAIRFTREYVGEETLPPIEGWSWYDAMRKHAPEVLAGMVPELQT